MVIKQPHAWCLWKVSHTCLVAHPLPLTTAVLLVVHDELEQGGEGVVLRDVIQSLVADEYVVVLHATLPGRNATIVNSWPYLLFLVFSLPLVFTWHLPYLTLLLTLLTL